MFISLDLETTGFDSQKDKIIEFGAVKFDLEGNEEKLQILINPGIQIPQIVTYITKIKDEHLKDAPSFDEKREEIAAFIGDLPIVGHNIQFDTGFLRENGIDLNNLEYDTHDLAAMLLQDMPSYSLEVLSRILNISHEDKHRALDDAIAAMDLFKITTEKFQALPEELIAKIHTLLEKSQWPLKNHLLNLKHKAPSVTTEEAAPQAAPQTSQHETILTQQEGSAQSMIPPYKATIKQLSTAVSDSTYIVIPDKLFREIEKDFPDSIAKIDSYSQYISESKFEEFCKKEQFENQEIAAVVKVLIWLNHTQTGILREVRIKGDELNILSHIAVSPETQDPLQEKYIAKALKRDKDSAAICSHQFLIENPPKDADLILFNYEEFDQSIYKAHSSYLTPENCARPINILNSIVPESESVKSLQSKLTILFGLIGILFEKTNDANQYGPRTYVNEEILNSKAWQEISTGISGLIEVSKELGDIKNDKTYRHLHTWKKRLLELDKIFRETNLSDNLIFIEYDWQDNLTVRLVPYAIENYIKEILDQNKSYKIIDETLVSIPEYISHNSKDSTAENIEVKVHRGFNDRDKFESLRFIKDLQEKDPKKRAVVVNSRKVMEFITLELAKTDLHIVSQLTASAGKLEANFSSTENALLILTPNMWNKITCHDQIEELVILKIPFEPPSDAILVAKSFKYSNAFEQLQVPRAASALKRIINRLSTANESRYVQILDPRLTSKPYGQKILLELAKSFSTS
jgi:DNA polymerase III epsilon subunit family exonuclease